MCFDSIQAIYNHKQYSVLYSAIVQNKSLRIQQKQDLCPLVTLIPSEVNIWRSDARCPHTPAVRSTSTSTVYGRDVCLVGRRRRAHIGVTIGVVVMFDIGLWGLWGRTPELSVVRVVVARGLVVLVSFPRVRAHLGHLATAGVEAAYFWYDKKSGEQKKKRGGDGQAERVASIMEAWNLGQPNC